VSGDPKSFVISIWNKLEDGELLLSIPCRSYGKSCDRVSLFMQCLCGDFDMQSYNLNSLGRDSRSNLPTLNSGSVLPGSYALVPNNGPVLSVTHQPLPIIPRGNLTPKSKSSSTPGSPSSIKKRTHEESEVHIEFLIFPSY
jgi:hypothetical protein